MSIKKVIDDDFKKAFKEGDTFVKNTLSMLRSTIKNKEINNKGELSDDQIIDLISSEIKRRKESARQYREGGRDDLAENEEKEIEVLQKYMPEPLSDDELNALIKEAIEGTGASDPKDMGKVMAALKDKTKGRVDGSVLAQKVKEVLQG